MSTARSKSNLTDGGERVVDKDSEKISSWQAVLRNWWQCYVRAQRDRNASGAQDETELSVDEWRRQHDTASNTLRSVSLTIVVYSLFCLLTLAGEIKYSHHELRQELSKVSKAPIDYKDKTKKPTVGKRADDSPPRTKIKVPFADTEIDFYNFLLIGPMILIGFTVYMQIFVEHLHRIGMHSQSRPLPYFFNVDRPFSTVATNFLFYWLTPGIVLLFAVQTYKISTAYEDNSEFSFLMVLALSTLFWLVTLNKRRLDLDAPYSHRRHLYLRILQLTRWFCVIGIAGVSYYTGYRIAKNFNYVVNHAGTYYVLGFVAVAIVIVLLFWSRSRKK